MKKRVKHIIIIGIITIYLSQLFACNEEDLKSKTYYFDDMRFSNALYALEVRNENPLIEGKTLTFNTSFRYLGDKKSNLYSGTVLIKLYIESAEGENPYDLIYTYTDEKMSYTLNQGDVIDETLTFDGLPPGDYILYAFTGVLELDGVLHEGYGYKEKLDRAVKQNPNNFKMHDYIKSQIFMKARRFTVGNQ